MSCNGKSTLPAYSQKLSLNYFNMILVMHLTNYKRSVESKIGRLETTGRSMTTEYLATEELMDDITSFSDITSLLDVPKVCGFHNVNVATAKLIKLSPYIANSEKMQLFQQEIRFSLEHKLLEEYSSLWASSCVLVKETR
nr:uncharacterized protein LOC128693392 isoform X1 [Cherax quadricarinatus]